MRIAIILPAFVLLASCSKDAQDLAQDTGLIPQGCGSAGARLEATIDGASYCGSAQLIATGDGATVVVTGVDFAGNTLVVQADSLAVGTHAITEASNSMLCMQAGTSFVVLPGEQGALTILEVDTAAHTLKASFSATLGNELSGQARAIQGSLEVVYTTEQ